MLLNRPTEEKIVWTNHSKMKMRQYRFSEKRVLSILRKPNRKEEGVADGTVANMQFAGTKKHPSEVWMMYQTINKKIRIISAWRYPGRTPENSRPVFPQDTMENLSDILENDIIK